jgi:hypothetical protein
MIFAKNTKQALMVSLIFCGLFHMEELFVHSVQKATQTIDKANISML